MSGFLMKKHGNLEMYTPGDQLPVSDYIKLNTNESPFPPPQGVLDAVSAEAKNINFYNDPDCILLRKSIAKYHGVSPENILPTNGSDEMLYFAFLAFGDEDHPIAFPDITYSYYRLYARMNHIPAHIIPLKDDFSVDYRDYINLNETVVIANPNAPTGLKLSREEIEKILKSNPNNVVLVDEAYVDFGGESCIPLINKYKNLLVTRTFSKSRSMAGARLGYGVACGELIAELNRVKYSVNPYNINKMTQAAGIAAIEDKRSFEDNRRKIIEARKYTADNLRALGFCVLDSSTNFVFASSEKIPAKELYEKLKKRGILIRYWDLPRISNFCRITIGSDGQMKTLITEITEILNERNKNA